jgi:hypothetical protein
VRPRWVLVVAKQASFDLRCTSTSTTCPRRCHRRGDERAPTPRPVTVPEGRVDAASMARVPPRSNAGRPHDQSKQSERAATGLAATRGSRSLVSSLLLANTGRTCQQAPDSSPCSAALSDTRRTTRPDHPDLRGHQPDPEHRDRKAPARVRSSVRQVPFCHREDPATAARRVEGASLRRPRRAGPALAGQSDGPGHEAPGSRHGGSG